MTKTALPSVPHGSGKNSASKEATQTGPSIPGGSTTRPPNFGGTNQNDYKSAPNMNSNILSSGKNFDTNLQFFFLTMQTIFIS